MRREERAAVRQHGGGQSSAAASLAQRKYTTNVAPAHGRIMGDTWAKRVRASVHMLRRPEGWAVDVADLAAAERHGVRVVRIYDEEAEANYWAALSTMRAYGKPLNRGFGEQLGLPLAWWRPIRAEAEALAEELARPEAEPQPVQLGLALGVAR